MGDARSVLLSVGGGAKVLGEFVVGGGANEGVWGGNCWENGERSAVVDGMEPGK